MQCSRCGNSNNVEKASTIVARETHYSTVTRGAVLANGQSATYQQGVTSQSGRAQALTADEPREGTGCWGTLLVGMLLMVPLTAFLLSCMGLQFIAKTDSDQTQLAIWVFASVLVFIAIIVISTIVSRQQKSSFNQRRQSWYNMFDRRYYCGDCGNIMQF